MSIPGVSSAAGKMQETAVKAAKGLAPKSKLLKAEASKITDKLDGRLAQNKSYQQGKANFIKIKDSVMSHPQVLKSIEVLRNFLNKISDKLTQTLQKRTPTANSKLAHRAATTAVNEAT